jgi:CSLREA domain-containing protein
MNIFTPTRRTCIRIAATFLSLILIAVVIPQLLTTRAAVTFTVNSLLDTSDVIPGNGICATANGVCTFRAAIQEANSFSGDDTINFSINGTINLTGPLPVISSNVIINGPGSDLLTVRRNTGGNYRILETTSDNSSISGLTITNGKTPDATTEDVAAPGGGILQTGGELTLRDVVITGNATGTGGPTRLSEPSQGGSGGDGGGIHATGGALTMTDCVIGNNTTGNGGTGSTTAGSGGRGGGIFFAPGNLTLNNVVISGNRTGDPGGLSGGKSGDGGGILSGDPSSGRFTVANLNKVTITNNSTGSGGNTADSGSGGGIYVNHGLLNLTDSTVSNNQTGNANPNGSSRTAGSGGGILNNSELIGRNSLISGNTTGSSSPSSHSKGGGISNLGDLTLINTTVSGNSTGSGASMGGGIFTDLIVSLTNCTITKNISPNGNGITGQHGRYVIANTLIAGNGATGNGPDLKNDLNSDLIYISGGNNLIGNADGVSDFNNFGDQTGSTATPLDPRLSPLANNGGPTLTHALLSNSTALDAGDNNSAATGGAFPPTDQRGAQRFADSPDADSTATVDIGAFEFLQTLEDIPNKTINEDTALTITFGLGDNGPDVTSVTASSNNQALLPNASLVLSGSGAARSLQLTPPANQSGVATITITVNRVSGGPLSDTFTLTVNSINDAPSFSIPSTQTALEDAGPKTIPNFATNVTAGPLENAQSISFGLIVKTNPGLFSLAPVVSSNGTLTFTPAPDQYGEALVSLILTDNGGTDNGGVDTSSEKTFTINILPVNDAPTFTKGANQTVAEDSFFQFVSEWATNISQGPNEFDAFNFQITNNTNPGLFVAQPVVSFGGLAYTPAADANGSAEITVVLKDTGGTANGGVDTSTPQTFTITVTPVNDAPRINLQSSIVRVNGQVPLVFSAANFNRIGLSDDSGTDPIRVTLTATQGTLTLPSTAGLTFVAGDGADDETMTFRGLVDTIDLRLSGLTFKPKNNVEGNANLQIVTDDEGHNGAGGAKTSSANIIILVDSTGPVLLTEELTNRAIALDLVNQTRDPFTLTNPFNLSNDQKRRVSLFIWNLGLLSIDTVESVRVVAQDDEGRFYLLPVEALATVVDVTQVVVRLPDNVIGAPRDLRVTVSLRGLGSNEAVIKIGAP